MSESLPISNEKFTVFNSMTLTTELSRRVTPPMISLALRRLPAVWKGSAMQFLTRFTAAFCVVVGAQGTNPSTPPKQSDLMMVRGCLRGLTLTTLPAADFDANSRVFQLTASREIATQLKQHTGHVEEVTGVLKAGKDAGATRVKEKRGTKGRVYGGFGSRTSREKSVAEVSAIDVRSVTHVQAGCP